MSKQSKVLEFNDTEAVTTTSTGVVWWKPEDQPMIAGYNKGRIKTGDDSENYVINDGEIRYALPNHVLLENGMANVPLGAITKVSMTGKQPTKDGKKEYFVYEVKYIPLQEPSE